MGYILNKPVDGWIDGSALGICFEVTFWSPNAYLWLLLRPKVTQSMQKEDPFKLKLKKKMKMKMTP